MAIRSIKSLRRGKAFIDLTSPAGNAFALMGMAGHLARKLGKDREPIIAEMKSGDYDHLLSVFDREFGEYVDLYR